MPRHKDGSNCEEVIGELSSIIRGTVSRTVNHEFCPSAFKDGLHEVDAETTQSVTVHDHNFFDQIAENGVQKGNKAFPFKVDATANVGDDFVIGEGFLKVFLLTSEVLSLVRRRHADVDDSTFGLRGRLSTLCLRGALANVRGGTNACLQFLETGHVEACRCPPTRGGSSRGCCICL